jgi:hypothetical protein
MLKHELSGLMMQPNLKLKQLFVKNSRSGRMRRGSGSIRFRDDDMATSARAGDNSITVTSHIAWE